MNKECLAVGVLLGLTYSMADCRMTMQQLWWQESGRGRVLVIVFCIVTDVFDASYNCWM